MRPTYLLLVPSDQEIEVENEMKFTSAFFRSSDIPNDSSTCSDYQSSSSSTYKSYPPTAIVAALPAACIARKTMRVAKLSLRARPIFEARYTINVPRKN